MQSIPIGVDMRTETGITIRREDYQPYPFLIPTIELEFELSAERTQVRSRLVVERRKDVLISSDLILNGEDLTLVSLELNGVVLSQTQYTLTEATLTVHNVPDRAELVIVGTCQPAQNTSLSGLYVSGKHLFTQCEPQGFRRITWFADRPDVMSIYRVTLRASRSEFPLLLSNGNLLQQRELEAGRHEAQWHDPFAKPSYLFAVVAGDFVCREHHTRTASGREVLLQVYSDVGTEDQTEWAMESLERALRWDETRFGLELDLDRFMIVAARDFNMGAMENKGLNIFNAAYVLANPNTATDGNFQAIESVIGHEYFHNWTGNRVTCRDWFELSLKEGLTVFRDQEFTADMMAAGLPATEAASARAVQRIDDVMGLRLSQYPEDRGPMAHPIRPESYQEISNFYTATVYSKGAEVIRMMHTLLGEQAFRAGMDEYFRRHDGQAVTCDDFINAMQWALQRTAPQKNLDVFRHWYRQAGTPRVSVQLQHDPVAKRCTVTLTQDCPAVGVEKASPIVKQPFHIPVTLGLLDDTGKSLSPQVTLELKETSQTWVFDNISTRPTPSLLRNFSAPVLIDYAYQDQELALLSAHDDNAFTRWEAGQEIASRKMIALAQAWRQHATFEELDPLLAKSWSASLLAKDLDAGYRARLLSIPPSHAVIERMAHMDPLAVLEVRTRIREQLGTTHAATLLNTYQANLTPGQYSPSPGPAGKRALKNLALTYLMASKHPEAANLTQTQFRHATNMTDRMAAFTALIHDGSSELNAPAATQFYEDWQHDQLVVDKWFSTLASSPRTGVNELTGLMAHPAFTMRNPNRVRAVVFAFCMSNTRGFHAQDGQGYHFWSDQVLALDAINPEIAARLARVGDQWARFIPEVSQRLHAQLERIATHPTLSRNTLEIVSKALSL
jgi:aminopeptidase N